MRKLRNLCILLILIALIVLGGTKALLWYYTDKTAKDIQNTLPPGMFNYAGISTSLEGSTSIDNISLIFSGQNIKIEKIELQANNIFGLLTLIAKNWGSKIPNELSLKLKGITIETSALLANRQIADQFQYPYPLPCGRIKSIGLMEYIDIGYDSFILDVDLAYQQISNKRIKFNFDLNVRDAVQSSFSFYGNNFLINPMVQSNHNKNIIPEFQMSIKNNTLQEKLYNYCAKQEHKSLTDYLKSLPPSFTKQTADKETVQAFGLTVSEEVINALNEYQRNPKELYIATKPKGDISFNELKAMNEQVALDLIQPILKVNGKNIPIQFQWMSTEAFAKSLRPVMGDYKRPVIKSSERILTPIDELNAKAFNKIIEVHTSSGMIYKGAFRKVEDNSLYMTIHKSWGTSDLSLKTNTVRLVYLLSDY